MKNLNLKITATIFIFALIALAGPVLACTPIGGINMSAAGSMQKCTATGYIVVGSTPQIAGSPCSALGEQAFDSTSGAPLYCNNANPKVWTAVGGGAGTGGAVHVLGTNPTCPPEHPTVMTKDWKGVAGNTYIGGSCSIPAGTQLTPTSCTYNSYHGCGGGNTSTCPAGTKYATAWTGITCI
jgi:hypothetical protein